MDVSPCPILSGLVYNGRRPLTVLCVCVCVGVVVGVDVGPVEAVGPLVGLVGAVGGLVVVVVERLSEKETVDLMGVMGGVGLVGLIGGDRILFGGALGAMGALYEGLYACCTGRGTP